MDDSPRPAPAAPARPVNRVSRGLLVLGTAMLFGFGWHVRGSGTSDPTVVIMLFLLWTGFLFGPDPKHDYVTFGLVTVVFRLLRRGWGTFVAQAGIPGVYEGHLLSYVEDYHVVVPWWQGYFWLFVVGVAWAGPAAFALGGYFCSREVPIPRQWLVMAGLYGLGVGAGFLLAPHLVSHLAPTAYSEVYLAGVSTRNYVSMRDNLAWAIGVVPPLVYAFARFPDKHFAWNTVAVHLIFGFGFAVADIWQVLGRNNPAWGIPFWSLWEYFSGFVIGALLAILYLRTRVTTLGAGAEPEAGPKSESDPESEPESDPDPDPDPDPETHPKPGPVPPPSKSPAMALSPRWHALAAYFFGHVGLFLYGLQESVIGMINSTGRALGADPGLETWLGVVIIVLVDAPVYWLFASGRWSWPSFQARPFHEKCALLLVSLLPVYYVAYVLQFVAAGTFLALEVGHVMIWLDSGSVVLVWLVAALAYRRWRHRERFQLPGPASRAGN